MAEFISQSGLGNTAFIVLTDEEALELYRFTQHDYISGRTYPALAKLLNRVSKRVQEIHAQCDTDRGGRDGAVGVSPSRDPEVLVSEQG